MGLWRARLQAPWLARALWIAIIAIALATPAGCSDARPSSGPTAPPQFPVGTYAKEFQDPVAGRVQINWVFDASGRWAEIPIALDNQTIGAGVVRGRFTVDGDVVTLATDYPAGMGRSRHEWRLDRDRLWTTFVSSDNADDAEWFAMLDRLPWSPVR